MTFFDSYTLHGGDLIDIRDVEIIQAGGGSFTLSGYRLHSNGTVYKLGPGGGASASLGYDWVTPTSNAPNYDVRATLVSGDTPSGTLNSWLPLSSSRSWSLTAVADAYACTLTIEIRDAATQTIRDTASVYLEVENV